MITERQVRLKKAFNAPGFPESWELQGRRRWQKEWTILRVWEDYEFAKADLELTKRRVFTDEEKDLMKGAK